MQVFTETCPYSDLTFKPIIFFRLQLILSVYNSYIAFLNIQIDIHPDRYTNTTYSVGDGGLTEINFTTAKDTKLTNIEAGADVTDESTGSSGTTGRKCDRSSL